MTADAFDAFTELAADPDPGPRVAVKDMIAVAGLPQEAGLAARAGIRATADAAAVASLRAAGWAIAGVARSDAAGFGTMTPQVQNPVHPGRAVGGSSGGAAAAVAGGLAVLGLGTDTGGSGRIPVAYCDLFALKFSHGRSLMDGVLPFAPSFDTLALMAPDCATLEAAAPAVVAGWGAGGAAAPRFVFAASVAAAAEPVVLEAFERVLSLLPRACPRDDPVPYDTMAMAHSTIVCAEALAVHGDAYARDPDGFPEPAASGLAYATTLSARDIAAARRAAGAARAAWRAAIAGDEVLVLPTLPMPPAARGAATVVVRGERMAITNANIRLTLFANVAGLPVVVAPVAGLSVQFVGAYGRDEWLLAAVGRLLENISAGS